MAELITTYLLHSTVILGVTLILIRLPGVRRAAVRDVLLRAAFIVSLITPWGLHTPAQVPLPLGQPTAESSTTSGTEAASMRRTASEALPAAADELGSAVAHTQPSIPSFDFETLAVLLPWLTLAFVAVAFMRFTSAAVHAKAIIKRARPADEALRSELGSVTETPEIRLLTTDKLDVPHAVGLRTILLPTGIADSLAPAELHAVLAHEIAHIQRRDPIWNAALSFSALALALQPLNLITLKAWRRASEEVCDAIAQERTNDPLALPRALVKMAHRRVALPSTIVVGIAPLTHLTHRVEALLSKRKVHMKTRRLAALALLPLAVGLLLPVLSSAQPSTPLDAYKVVLDAGHGGEDAGAEGVAREADVVLAIALHVRRILAEHGVQVVLTRESRDSLYADRSEDLTMRRALADADTDAFVSIHASAGSDTGLHGIQTSVAPQSTYTSDRESRYDASVALATALQEELIEQTGARDRSVTEQSWYVLQHLEAPAVLVDAGFVTHPEEGARLATSAYQEQLAQAIADGILHYLRAQTAELEGELVKPAFTVLLDPDANAEALLQQMRAYAGIIPHTVTFLSRDEAVSALHAQHPSLLQ